MAKRSRREILVQGIGMASILAAPSLVLAQKGKVRPQIIPRKMQNGTNPIVSVPPTVQAGKGDRFYAIVYPGTDDVDGNEYNVKVAKVAALKKTGVLSLTFMDTGIKGIDGGAHQSTFTFRKKTGSTKLKPELVEIFLDDLAVNHVISILIYGKDGHLLSATATVELLHN